MIILSIDGGGMRGLVPAMILAEIEKTLGKHSVELFDMFVGTSTGGIIITALNAKDEVTGGYLFGSSDIFNFYLKKVPYIFEKELFTNIKNIFKPKYDSEKLKNILINFLGKKLLTDSIKPCLIPAFNLSKNNAVVFKSRKDAISLVDVCMSTTAAPTYFKNHSFLYQGEKNCFVDGGVFANSPGMIGLAEMLKWGHYYYGKSFSLEEIKILSLGTGTYGGNINFKGTGGMLMWAKNIADVMLKGVSQTTDYQLKQILPKDNYLRIQLNINDFRRRNMDDGSLENIDYLISETKKQIIDSKIMDDIYNFIKK